MGLEEIARFQEISSRHWIRKVEPGQIRAHNFEGTRDLEFDPVKQAVLALSLYNDDFFDLPLVGRIEDGWRADWFETGPNLGMSYEIAKDEWTRFQAFLQIAQIIPLLLTTSRFSIAANRYLQATFARGDAYFSQLDLGGSYTWDVDTGEEVVSGTAAPDERSLKEDVLLNYMFALETLVGQKIRGSSTSKESRYPGARVAHLIGRHPKRKDPKKSKGLTEREWIESFLRSAYDDRHDIVHEGFLQREPADLRVLRRCCQRALGVVMVLSYELGPAGVEKLLSELPSSKQQKVVESTNFEVIQNARRGLFRSISDSCRLDEWTSPTTPYRGRTDKRPVGRSPF